MVCTLYIWYADSLIFSFNFAVLQNTWNLLTQCFHSYGGLLDSIGCRWEAQRWLVMRLSYTGSEKIICWIYLVWTSGNCLHFPLMFFFLILFCRLCIVFLAFDVFFVVFCVALACIIGIAVCCCLPCIIAVLYAVADQVIHLND